jgi:hypothetical protein
MSQYLRCRRLPRRRHRGDLLLVPYPFTDLSAAKRRPVLALTAPDGYGDFTVLQGSWESASIHAGSGVIWGIPDQTLATPRTGACFGHHSETAA